MKSRATPDGLPQHRYPVDEWNLTEVEYSADDLGLTETLFSLGNGYLGLRANPEEGREAHSHGTYLNQFHETWDIKHAEDAYAFAKTGQTIVNAPDAKLMKLYVDDEPLILRTADLERYERRLDMKSGVLHRSVIWHTPAGKRVRVDSSRMVSFEHRHLAVFTLEVTVLNADAPVVVSSQLINRQDGEDEYHVRAAALGEGGDPRKTRKFDRRVLEPRLQEQTDDDIVLGYRCAQSKMTLACGYRHVVETEGDYQQEIEVGDDLAKTVLTFEGKANSSIKITKFVSYHTSTGVPCSELADRCNRTLQRAEDQGVEVLEGSQQAWLGEYWASADIEIGGDPSAQQAVRWNLYQLAQASARVQEQGIAAKAVSAGGYDGHYFWDTEIYVLPFLAYTQPSIARKLIRFRWDMLDSARKRAEELSQSGALYPWRTINGEEASAYYAAGTAQYHINAAVSYSIQQYVLATNDRALLAKEGAEILVETARLWSDLGFASKDGLFHIHRVTGPDEYTTVVNDNFYTNAMAQANLQFAADTMEWLQTANPDAFEAIQRKTGVTADEAASWSDIAKKMYFPYDLELGIHPQDDAFLELERWPFETTPDEKYPLLLHFHPLVIYRHQVLKQADVVLAMYLLATNFTTDQKRRNFDYYDSITSADSSLSACVQAIVAAEVGHQDLADQYFREALYLDLLNLHHWPS